MCTAAVYKTRNHYFGRNLDLEHSYTETVTITPRGFPLRFRCVDALPRHLAMIGMAHVAEGYPLYYEATNEMGLSMAALNFPEWARYQPERSGMDNVAPFELIPWVLGQCASLKEARTLLGRVNLAAIPFSRELPLTPLHWIVAHREGSLVAEPMEEGLRLWDDPVGVLTNSPPFDFHLTNLRSYLGASRDVPVDRFAQGLDLRPYSRGMGAMGLPGDLSSPSRFVRAAFTKCNAVSGDGEEESVGQFFHILISVEQQRGCVRLEDGRYEHTVYSSCCNTDRGIYYYTTYGNRQITGVDLHREDLEGGALVAYPLVTQEQIRMEN